MLRDSLWALLICSLPFASPAAAHDIITTKITFDREIIRIINSRCSSCHKPGGSAFSLVTYNEARPWAKAVQEEVLERRMPPWGAVKGFGDFKNDQALTPEQIEVIAAWVEGGAPEGEDKDLPVAPKPAAAHPATTGSSPAPRTSLLTVGSEYKFQHAVKVAAITPQKIPLNQSFQVTAELPNGAIEPLLWLQPFKPAYAHAFWFREPVMLAKGTMIHGVPQGATLVLSIMP